MTRPTASLPAVVIVAHDQPEHLRRLIDSLDPLPVFLHVDANTRSDVFTAMTAGLPSRVRLLPRIAAGWARFEVLAAELLGYRTALAETSADHVIMATGADYPLVPVERITALLSAEPNRSRVRLYPLPVADWGPLGGRDRFLFRQRPWRRHRLVLPVPRRLPRGLTAGGGAQTKILTRRHAQIVLDALDDDPALLRFFASCWTPDEVTIPTILLSERFGAHWEFEGTGVDHHPWFIDWGHAPAKHPRTLGIADLPALRTAVGSRPGVLFARKFGPGSGELADAIDRELRSVVVQQ